MAELPDYLDEPGARRIANRIERFWRGKGMTVECRVVPMAVDMRNRRVFVVRSDMVAGLPRRTP